MCVRELASLAPRPADHLLRGAKKRDLIRGSLIIELASADASLSFLFNTNSNVKA